MFLLMVTSGPIFWNRADTLASQRVAQFTSQRRSDGIESGVVQHEQIERLVEADEPSSRLEDGSPASGQPRQPFAAARRMSFESASRNINRPLDWSWNDRSHLHCLFSEEILDAIGRREELEVLCAEYVRRPVQDVESVQHRHREE